MPADYTYYLLTLDVGDCYDPSAFRCTLSTRAVVASARCVTSERGRRGLRSSSGRISACGRARRRSVAMAAPVGVRYPLIRATWRSQRKVSQRSGTLIAVAVFIAVYLVSLYASSGAAAAGSGRVVAPPTEHIVYTSDEGPPDEAPVPVLTQHPVHGPEVRGWRTRSGTRSALSREIAHLPELEEPHSST